MGRSLLRQVAAGVCGMGLVAQWRGVGGRLQAVVVANAFERSSRLAGTGTVSGAPLSALTASVPPPGCSATGAGGGTFVVGNDACAKYVGAIARRAPRSRARRACSTQTA